MWRQSGFLLFLCLKLVRLSGERVELEQERHKIIVPAKTESCFFISDLQQTDLVTVNYLVISFSNGKQQDITFRLKDPATSRLISYQARKGTGNVTSHEVKQDGELQFCFNNRHSMIESKKLVWEFRVSGEEREEREVGAETVVGTNQTEEYLEQANRVRRAVVSVRGKVARSKHSQWWLGLKVCISTVLYCTYCTVLHCTY